MKAIMISIKPEYVCKILNKEKLLEIRKSIPKCELPCKVYIYCTKGKDLWMHNKETIILGDTNLTSYWLNGKVVAEFTLNKVEKFECSSDAHNTLVFDRKSCLSIQQVRDYCNGQDLYGWHIDNLIIYDKPKELSEFYIETIDDDCCVGCPYHETPIEERPCKNCYGNRKYITRPPQSWCYVEQKGEE